MKLNDPYTSEMVLQLDKTHPMRIFQITLFILAAASLASALLFIGKQTGQDLWMAGIAILLFDVVCLQLWPGANRGLRANERS